MTYLLLTLAVVTATMQNIISKLYNINVKSDSNSYMFCSLSTFCAMLFFIITSGGKFDFDFSFIEYSLLFAASYSAATIGNYIALTCGPLSVTTLVIQCSLVVPTLYGIAVLNERLKIFGYLGILLLIVSLFLVNFKSSSDEKISPKWLFWVTLGFIGNGMCSTTQKMQQLKFDGAYKNEFMIVALAIGTAVMLIMSFKDKGSPKNLVKSAFVSFEYAFFRGISNGALNFLVIIMTSLLPTAVLFPVILAGSTVLTFVISVAFFRERLTLLQLIGYALGIISIIFINL